MAKSNLQVFAQTQKAGVAVVTAADDLTSAPVGVVLLATMGIDGGLFTAVGAMPLGNVSDSSLHLFLELDGVAGLTLMSSELMLAHVIADATKIPETVFGDFSESVPKRLPALAKVYAGCADPYAAGTVFTAQWTDY